MARPGATAGTVMIFSLGVGLLSAMFALTDPFILRPLPYARPHELVHLESIVHMGPGGVLPPLNVRDLAARTDLFRGVAAFRHLDRDARQGTMGSADSLREGAVSPNFFDVLGVDGPMVATWSASASTVEIPILLMSEGFRTLSAEDRRPGHRLVRQDGTAFRVFGRAPSRFVYPTNYGQPDGLVPFVPGDAYTVASMPGGGLSVTENYLLLARLKEGVTPTVVEAALNGPSGPRVKAHVLSDWLRGDLQRLAWGAFGASVLVLLVCAGNVANIFVARAVWRFKEFATREALGASRGDIVRLWAVESALVTGAALVLGLTVAWLSLRVSSQVIPQQYVGLGEPAINTRVVGVAAAVAAVVTILGLIPAALISRLAPRALSGRLGTESRRVRAIRIGFTVAQTALAMILAIGAGLLVQSYVNLMRQDKGYHLDSLATGIGFVAARPSADRFAGLQASIDELRRLPGVRAVGATAGRLVDDHWKRIPVTVRGLDDVVDTAPITEDYFAAAGIALVSGRELRAGDRQWNGVVVNQAFVAKYLEGVGPLGQLVGDGNRAAAIVGVVRDVLDRGMAETSTPLIYNLMEGDDPVYFVRFVVRPAEGHTIRSDQIRTAIDRAWPEAIVGDVSTLGTLLANTVRERTFATIVLTLFCLAGGSVTVAGLVSIVSFVVARRTREIAIRTAIGATPGDIRRLVVREAVIAAIGGGVVGLVMGRWLSTWLQSLVFGVEAGSWTTATAAVAGSLIIMIGAALIPAGRAVQLQPNEALRVE
jgi:predicted permease